MDKKVIENFAVEAREELVKTVQLHLSELGIDNNGIHERLPESTNDIEIYIKDGKKISGKDIVRRQSIVNRLDQLSQANKWDVAYEQFVEEVAYTWFNQVVAIRFMEVNRYLPSGVRVLSSEYGYAEPDILHRPFDVEDDLGGFSEEERSSIQKALDTQQAADLDTAYGILFSKQLKALNSILPFLFTESKDYLRLLIDPKYASGVIHELVNEVPEANFDIQKDGQVEIIGWLYQYYNETPKNDAFKKRKYGTYDIPAVTQLFTPDWIVKYLVENSLGRYWINVLQSHGDSRSEKVIAQDFGWKYYMPAAKQVSSNVQISNKEELSQTQPEDVSFIDPAMGSGHILVYAFDVFMTIYESEGYSRREACQSILEHNLYGLDIDTRAYQLTYFSIMMKARQYDRRILTRSVHPQVYDVPEIDLSDSQLNDFLALLPTEITNDKLRSQLEVLLKQFQHGNELGSLISFRGQNIDFQSWDAITDSTLIKGQLSLNTSSTFELQRAFKNMLNVAQVLSGQYDISVTNPPYMAHGKMPKFLGNFASKQFPNSKSDLFAMFIERLNQLTTNDGYYALITQHQWMFLSSYEKLRSIITKYTMINMAHMGTRAFEEIGGEVVQSTAFVMQKEHKTEYVGTFERLVSFDSQQKKQDAFLSAVTDSDLDYVYHTDQSNFSKIPGSPIAYWASRNLIHDFEVGKPLGEIVESKTGLSTGDNDKFIRQWYEVNFNEIQFDAKSIEDSVASHKKWFPFNKGGSYRKWYGNFDYVVNWKNDGSEIRNFRDNNGKIKSYVRNSNYYFLDAITWSDITSGETAFRRVPRGVLFSNVGLSLFAKKESIFQENGIAEYLLGLLNSEVGSYILKFINPTIHSNPGDVAKIPILQGHIDKQLVRDAIQIEKTDWNLSELSWNFIKPPLLPLHKSPSIDNTVQQIYKSWSFEVNRKVKKLNQIENNLNQYFIKLYGLQSVLSADQSVSKITVHKPNRDRDIRSLLSFFVGVTFGRYSIDNPGLTYAGGNWDQTKYQTYQPNEDDIILLTEDDYFGDNRDILFRFKEFLVDTFGKDHLDENIEFIANALGKRKANHSAEQQIRDYFFNDFYKKDHVKMYRKRPIYWEINSGRQGGFRALIYLHRYDENTMATIRTKYLHPLQAAYENKLDQLRPMLEAETTAKSKNQLQRQLDKITKQRDELVKFDAKLQHVANMHIKIDLDDGVLVNHEKVQGGEKILMPIK